MPKFTGRQARQLLRNAASTLSGDDVEAVLTQQDKLEKKLAANGPLARFVADIKLLLSLLKDYVTGRYREVPWRMIASVTGALLYVLNPIDVIPDFLTVFGLADDAMVMAACLSLIEKDLKQYQRWKTQTAIN